MLQSNPHYTGTGSGALARALEELVTVVARAPAFLALGLIAVFLLVRHLMARRPRRRWRPRRTPANVPDFRAHFRAAEAAARTAGGGSDPAAQMHAIAKTGFVTVPLLNRSEARLLPALERVVQEAGQGHRLMAQTSLGEILRPTGASQDKGALDAAYGAINSKRLDFAVFNRFGHLAVALEYQGHGHYHATSFMRDAVKREALRKAGVPLIELPADIRPEAAAALLASALTERQGGAAQSGGGQAGSGPSGMREKG